MSKQVYIDENGNEILLSGTVNTADMMPMSGNDNTKVSEAIEEVETSLDDKPTNTNANPYLKIVFSSNVTKTVGAGATVPVLGSDINLAQVGYTPIALCSMYSTSPNIVFSTIDCRIVSGSSAFCYLRNITNASVNVTVNFTILFMRNSN